MKRQWKLIAGVIFVIGGIGNASNSISTFMFGVIGGIVLLAWHFSFFRRKSAVDATDRDTTCHDGAGAKPAAVAAHECPMSKHAAMPQYKEGAPRQYCYQREFEPGDMAARLNLSDHQGQELNMVPSDNGIDLFLNQEKIGTLKDAHKLEMLKNWIKRGDPYMAVLGAAPNTATIAFYRDKRKKNEFREQTVIALTSYKSSEKQEALSYINEGDEVELDEDNDIVKVLYLSMEIGRLPKKQSLRVIEEGAYAAFLEKCEAEETDNYDTINKPHIRIYW